MKTLTTLISLPMFLLGAALPAQEHDGKDKQDPKTLEKPKKEDKVTKGDPAIRAIDKFIKKVAVNKDRRGWKQTLKSPPKVEFSEFHDYFWNVKTSAGDLKIRYFADTAPIHVTSGIYLSRLGYYDGLNFHRIIPKFMAQGGCPTGTGTGGPGYFMAGEHKGGRKHDRPGLLSMANTGRPRSDGAQFFLTFVPTPHLDGKHTLWGEVVGGKETLKALEALGTSRNNGSLGAKGPKIIQTWITVEPKKVKPAKTGEHDGKEGKEGKGEHGGEGHGEHGGR